MKNLKILIKTITSNNSIKYSNLKQIYKYSII